MIPILIELPRSPASQFSGRPIPVSDCLRRIRRPRRPRCPPSDLESQRSGRRSWRSKRDRPPAREHAAGLVANVTVITSPAPLNRAICMHSIPMLPWPTRRSNRQTGYRPLDRRHAVAQRLQAGPFAVGNAIVQLDQRNGRQDGPFRKAAGELKPDDRPARQR